MGRRTERGIATLVAKAPAPDLRAVDVSLERLAGALRVLGDESDHDILRAKALGLLSNPEAALDVIRRAQERDSTGLRRHLRKPHGRHHMGPKASPDAMVRRRSAGLGTTSNPTSAPSEPRERMAMAVVRPAKLTEITLT